jgi:hypothetical protein
VFIAACNSDNHTVFIEKVSKSPFEICCDVLLLSLSAGLFPKKQLFNFDCISYISSMMSSTTGGILFIFCVILLTTLFLFVDPVFGKMLTISALPLRVLLYQYSALLVRELKIKWTN